MQNQNPWQKHALVVDDYPTNAGIAVRYLEQGGYRVTVCFSGLEAVQKCSEELFDFVLIDIVMPDIDGVEAASRIRVLPGYSHVPIYGLTATYNANIARRGLDSGMTQVLPKPLKRELLYQILDDLSPNEGFCYPALLEIVEGNTELACEVLKSFYEESINHISCVEKAIQKSDAMTVHRLVHGYKGACENIGEMSLSWIARRVEERALANDLQGVARIFSGYELIVEGVIRRMKNHGVDRLQ